MSQLPWYVARASGIVAWLLLGASVVWGLTLSTKVLGRRPRPAWLLDLHRYLAGCASIFTGIHVTSILVDTYTDFSLMNVLVPFTGTWHPVAVAWGVVGLYLLAAVEITSLLRRHLSKRAWRLSHYLSFPLFVVSTVHLLTAGSDVANPLMWWSALVVAGLVSGLTVVRVGTFVVLRSATDSLRSPGDRALIER